MQIEGINDSDVCLVTIEETFENDSLEVDVALSLINIDVDVVAEMRMVPVKSPNADAALDRNGAALRNTSWQSD